MKAAFSWGSGGRAGVQDTTGLVGRRSPREREGQQGRDRIGRQGAGAGQTHQDTLYTSGLCLIFLDADGEGGATFREERKESD